MDTGKTLKEQKKVLILIIATIGLLACVFAYFVVGNEPPLETQKEPVLVLPTDTINPQESWNSQTNDQIAIIDEKIGFIESVLLDSKEQEAASIKENAALKAEIEGLKRKIEEQNHYINATPSEKKDGTQQLFPSNEEIVYSLPSEPRRPLTIKKADFKKELVKNVEKTIPSGTTVKAVLVSSVDAPCGAYSSADPQPVKLQILDDGHLPKKVRALLKGGLIIASAYGDLSSERIYLRLERLTQVKPSGDFVETVVTGFVTGEDGKYGVRGSVVDRSAKLVENAAISGIFSGANSFFQAYAASRWSPWSYGCGPCYSGDDEPSSKELAYGLAAQGGTEGASNAFDTLTDYYIRRAELIKPVIQVNAGRIVDITFTLGTEIGDLHAHESREQIRKNSRSQNG